MVIFWIFLGNLPWAPKNLPTSAPSTIIHCTMYNVHLLYFEIVICDIFVRALQNLERLNTY